jgi:glycosyltransferase involved in cell wall biosynthesis
MKVVFCAYDFVNKVGGPNVWLLRLLPALLQRGVQVKALFMSQDPASSPTAAALARQGVETVVVGHFPTTEQKVGWILEQLRRDPPDVFVPNLAVPGYYAGGWVRQAGIPTVGVLHSDDDFHRGLQEQFVFGDEFFRVSGLACVSEFLQQEVSQRGPRNIDVRKIPCGAPLPTGQVLPPAGKLKLVYVGRLEEQQKRISEVALALCRAVREIPGVEATLFGEGSAHDTVENILSVQGAGLAVHLAGKVSSAEIQRHLLEQHVLVLLSDFEGLPIALMEAMACGLVPVCKLISSGVPELVEHEVNGLLVTDRGDDFVAAVRRLKDDPQLWQRLSTNARQKIANGYSDEACDDRWYQFLVELCNRSRSGAAIKIPQKISLPPVHPWLAREDFRKPPAATVFVNRVLCFMKRLAGRENR